MTLSTPLALDRGKIVDTVDSSVANRNCVYTSVYGLTTPRCGHQNRQFPAALTPLSTLSTPYIIYKGIGCKSGVYRGSESRDRFSDRGVDTLGRRHAFARRSA